MTGATGGAPFAIEAAAAFERAAAVAGVRQFDGALAGRPLRLRFAGEPLADLLSPAFAHLYDETPAPAAASGALCIDAWDRVSSGVPAPRPRWTTDDYLPREHIRGHDDLRYDLGHGLLTIDRVGGGLFHALDHARVPRWVVRMPFRHLIGAWARREQLLFVHAAAVSVDGRCVLLPGTSGSGKSTTALTAAAHGFGFLADDLCLVDPAGPTAHAPYALAKLERDALERLPVLRAAIRSTEEGQSMIDPPGLVRSARVVAIAVPRVAHRPDTVWASAPRALGLRAMAPSTLIEGNGADRATMTMIRTLGESLPCFDLALGTDVAGVLTALHQILEACR